MSYKKEKMITNPLNIILTNSYWLINLVIAFIISTFLMPFIIKLNIWLNCLDTTDGRKIHKKPTATMGGLGIYISLLLTYLILGKFHIPTYFWYSISILVITGILDDIYGLRWFVKLSLQAIAALIFILMGSNFEFLFKQIGFDFIPVFIQAVLLVIFIILYINAFNLIDGIDGLAGGIALINFMVFGLLNYYLGNYAMTWICVVLIGGITGFLIFNTHPAKIFMGDTGSLTLGFLLILAAFNTFQFHYHIVELNIHEKQLFIWVIISILFLPFADAVRVFFTRIIKKKAPYLPGKDHIHHLLMNSGLGQKETVFILYSINILFVITGLIIYLNKPISLIISILL